ncbi:MAG TPA: sugar ABC transporter permease, partial [Nitrososphaerales archaeon]|nr:sugar ABC transporter permease [Nitrososphaerales archaeon]
LLLAPVIAALAAVEAYPLAYTVYLSLFDYQAGKFVGLTNFSLMLSSSEFWGAVFTSVLYSTASTALAVILGVLLALQVSTLSRGRAFAESVFLAPLAIAPVVVGTIWSPGAVWDDFNTFIHFVLGFPFVDVTTYGFFFPTMVVSDAYEWAPLLMLVSLGIIGGLRGEIYEAAVLHGATTWQVFRRIYLPAIVKSPVFEFVVVLRFVDAMRAFEIPFTWSTWLSFPNAGSPVDTLSLYLFKLFSVPAYGFPIGLISAVATTLVMVTVIFTAVLYRMLSRTGSVH